jgi:hypothetical protein
MPGQILWQQHVLFERRQGWLEIGIAQSALCIKVFLLPGKRVRDASLAADFKRVGSLLFLRKTLPATQFCDWVLLLCEANNKN